MMNDKKSGIQNNRENDDKDESQEVHKIKKGNCRGSEVHENGSRQGFDQKPGKNEDPKNKFHKMKSKS